MSAKQNNIICTGFIENKVLSSYIAASDLMVIPSLCNEGAGLVAIEGLSLNKQLVVTRSGGLTEFTDSEYAVYISKDYFDFDWHKGDITNKMVEETDWSIFEEELKNCLIDCYNKRDDKKKDSFGFAQKFDITTYYSNFMSIIYKIGVNK